MPCDKKVALVTGATSATSPNGARSIRFICARLKAGSITLPKSIPTRGARSVQDHEHTTRHRIPGGILPDHMREWFTTAFHRAIAGPERCQ